MKIGILKNDLVQNGYTTNKTRVPL